MLVLFTGALQETVTSGQVYAQDTGIQAYSIISSTELQSSASTPPGREVHCACITSDDRILVYRQSGTDPVSADLSANTDFSNALWLFDVGNKGRTQIAVHFHQLEGQLVADVYQDQDGDSEVSLKITDETADIVEPGTWSIRVIALDGYWQKDGRLAANLDILVDDRFAAAFGSEVYQNEMANDGLIDIVARIRGPRENDPRSYDWRNVYVPVLQSSGILRTTLSVRENGVEPAFAPRFPWYFLGEPIGIVKDVGISFPPIQIDWDTGKIQILAEFVASRGSDVNWFTYSLIRVEPNTTTDPNFESPFAFYDLAQDQDSIPELAVRVDRVVENDPYRSSVTGPNLPSQYIRYSWDQNNSQNWSFKLGLLGQHTIDGIVSFPEFTLQTIPYEEVPSWVTERQWDIATFVAAEGPLWTSEGIYDWDPNAQISGYYAGTTESISSFGTTIAPRRRGEYALSLQDQPWLYFSAIDRQLHLAHAESGVWNIDNVSQIRYFNSSDGETFDGWQRWDDGHLAAELYRLPNGLLFSNQQGTFFKRVNITDSLFRALPPANHDEWQQLGREIETNQVSAEPGDLQAMFDQFDGEITQLSAEAMTHFSRSNAGMSFIVDTNDVATREILAQITGSVPGVGLQRVKFEEDSISVAPVVYAIPTIAIDINQQHSLQTVPVRITVSNPGDLSLTEATLSVQAVSKNGEVGASLGEQAVVLLGQEEMIFAFAWPPGQPGEWTIQATLQRSDGDPRTGENITLQQQSKELVVLPPKTTSTLDSGIIGWPGGVPGRVLVWMGMLLAIITVALTALWKSHRE